MTEIIDERPTLVQGSEAPIVIREGDKLSPLICEGCNDSVLIENYLAECFVGIGFECFKCQHITMTPSLPAGEIFPQMPVSLGRKGKYLIGSSVVNRKDAVMTCDQELEASSKLTDPKKVIESNFELSLENLDKISDELNLLSAGRFNKYIASAKRSINHKSPYFRENPLAWSIEMLRKQLENNELTMSKQTLVALGFLQGYRDVFERWKDHIHFPILITEICAYFYHSLIQLIVASYLKDAGNRIAINIAGEEDGERTADLYIRISGSEKLFLEVKGPEALEWTNTELKTGKMKKVVEKCLSNSRGQIDIDKPGVLIIGATCLNTGFLEEFENTVQKVLKTKGKLYPAITGICVVGLKEISASGGRSISTSFNISMNINDHYYQDNPINKGT
jgi:hypothetical protein